MGILIYPGELFDKSNKTLIEAGVNVEPDYYRHTASYINGVMIENHRVLCDPEASKTDQGVRAWLKREANRSLKEGESAWVMDRVPCGFSQLRILMHYSCLGHVSAHFMFERVTIRHILDWALFLTHEGREIDVKKFLEAKRRFDYGFSKLADAITNLSIRYLKMPVADMPLQIVQDAVNFDDDLADKVIDYMFVGQPRERDENVWKFRWNNVRRVWNERWKYKEFYGMSPVKFLFYKAYGALFHIGE